MIMVGPFIKNTFLVLSEGKKGATRNLKFGRMYLWITAKIQSQRLFSKAVFMGSQHFEGMGRGPGSGSRRTDAQHLRHPRVSGMEAPLWHSLGFPFYPDIFEDGR